MDADWEEVSRLLLPAPGGPQNLPTPVQCLAFDTSQELLWVGNGFGRVMSFSNSDLQRYTSCKVADGQVPVRQILIHDKGIISLSPTSVHMSTRRGPPLWHIAEDGMKDLHCMSFTSKGNSEILVAGLQDQMFVIDVEKGTTRRQLHTNYRYKMMKRSRHICAAGEGGTVVILDSTTFAVLKTWEANYAIISDMDAQHDFIVLCGISLRAGGQYMNDTMVKVFDLKTLKALPPLPFPAGAAHVRMHPRMSTTSIVTSHTGQMHIVDLMNPNTSNIKQANSLSSLMMLEIAPSGRALAIVDAECYIHLWGPSSNMHFAEVSNPIEYPDAVEVQDQVDWNGEKPLSTIGLPYYRDLLLSAWPSHMTFNIGAPPLSFPQIPPAASTLAEWGYYGPRTDGLRPNEVINTRATEQLTSSLQAPKFLSQMARESANDDSSQQRRISDVADAIGIQELSSLKAEVPVMYRNVEIKYSKFGVDDFDFGFYNKTIYSGLEIHISNSYANPLLQVMHYTPLIRNIALQHAATSCINDLCLLCEMGFLFDMLEKAEGSICQATNLLKTFSNHPQAGPLKLLEEDAPGSSLTTMLQGLNRFLLDRIAQDFRSIAPSSSSRPSVMDKIISMPATETIRCMNCRSEHSRPGTVSVTELIYPVPKLLVRNPRPSTQTFSQILKSSIEKEQTSRGWCSRCQRYQSLATRKATHDIPAVLILNAAINSPEAKQFWSIPGWLPEEIGIIIDGGAFYCYQGDDLKSLIQRRSQAIAVYSLIGIAADIDSGQNQKSHLVSLINVAHSLPQAPAQSQWHLFNDFLVRPVKTEEALSFNTAWKLPSVITYHLKAANNHIDQTWREKIDTSLLYKDPVFNPRGEKKYRTLTPEEAPGEGTLIALDTEFVAIRQAEIEMNPEGERETIRPTVFALARVSVIRGAGENEGLPFIDDYIVTKEPVVDYLTSYSGIVQGDLDPAVSKHNLVSLKIAYKKLWILLNLGCKFLGHGLKQDFRVTNIHVPKTQVIDTIEFFFVKARLRKLSLSFLAYYLLKEDIQVKTHDSIEDSRTALKLYRKYLEFQDAGVLDSIIADIYRAGREMNFKPPPSKTGELVQRTETPPIIDGQVQIGSGGLPGPTTPVRKYVGLAAPGTGGSGWTPGKGSPLR